MIACRERQWPTTSRAIACEDTCPPTPYGGPNLTCDERDDIA